MYFLPGTREPSPGLFFWAEIGARGSRPKYCVLHPETGGILIFFFHISNLPKYENFKVLVLQVAWVHSRVLYFGTVGLQHSFFGATRVGHKIHRGEIGSLPTFFIGATLGENSICAPTPQRNKKNAGGCSWKNSFLTQFVSILS